MKKTTLLSLFAVFFFSETSFGQDAPPAPGGSTALCPCKAPAGRPHRRRRASPAKTPVTDTEVLRRLDVLEARPGSEPLIQVLPAPVQEAPRQECPTPPVVHNHITVTAPAAANQDSAHNTRFGLELGWLASVHSLWWETSSGYYGALRFSWKRLVLGVEAGYQRTIFNDGSTIEDVYAEPTAGYEFGKNNLRFTVSGGFGFWTTREDWVTPRCGRADCGDGNENALTANVAPGLILELGKTLKFSFALPVRWISKTPDGAEWTFGLQAGLGVWTP